jgi:hypothetical protein
MFLDQVIRSTIGLCIAARKKESFNRQNNRVSVGAGAQEIKGGTTAITAK